MKLTLLFVLSLGAAFAQLNGTFDPNLPDYALYNYSGDQYIDASISGVDFRRQVTVVNTAACGQAGFQTPPAVNPASNVGGRESWSGADGYPTDPSNGRIPLQCLPLDVNLAATWFSKRLDGINDHLGQSAVITPIGGLVGSTPSISGATEACSLFGKDQNGYISGLGYPYVTYYHLGDCYFYPPATGPIPPGGSLF